MRRVDVSHGGMVAFGNQATFAASSAQTLGVTNTGNLPLTLSGLTVSGPFAQGTTGSSDCTATTVLAAGQSCVISLTFTPNGAGSATGSVSVTDNTLGVAGSTQTTALSGTGVLTANKLVIGGLGATSVSGAAQTITVSAYSNTLAATDYVGTVHFSSTDATAVLPANYTFTTADNGVHSFSITLKAMGAQTVTVADTGNVAVGGSVTTTVAPGVPAAITALSGGGQITKVSTAYAQTLAVLVKDGSGNR